MSPPHNDIFVKSWPRLFPKTLVSLFSKVSGLPQPEVSVEFLCKEWTVKFSLQPMGTCFCLETTCSFYQEKKCTQHETKERNKISLMHCQATVLFLTTAYSLLKHKDVCHMVNEIIWENVRGPWRGVGWGIIRFPILWEGLWPGSPFGAA